MPISERITNTIEGWRTRWGAALRGYLVNALGGGIELILDIVGRGLGKRLDTIIDTIGAERDWPPEVRETAKMIWKGEGEWQALLGATAGGTATGGLISSTLGPWLKLMEYEVLRGANSARLEPMIAMGVLFRSPELRSLIESDLRDQGWTDERIDGFEIAAKNLMSADLLTRYKWRFAMPDEEYYTKMGYLGFKEDEAARFEAVSKFYPAPADLVRWQAREVFEPEMVARYGLDSELEAIEREPFYKAGMTEEQIVNYWRAHWEHASWMQVVEMLHRGLVTEAEVYDWFRLVEIPPFWRDLLIQTAYTWPTRVDVRRWWDMRTIDEARLRELYEGMGYRGKNLEDYVKWTKVYTDFPMMMARFRNGWITEDEIYQWLIAQDVPAERARHFIEEKVKAEKPERVTSERNLTKSEIYRGVKKEVITWEQGIDLLLDMGYDSWEAEYILVTNVGTLEGSPETFEEFKDWTHKYRKAQGLEPRTPEERMEAASGEVLRLNERLGDLKRRRAPKAEIQAVGRQLQEAQAHYEKLRKEWEAAAGG